MEMINKITIRGVVGATKTTKVDNHTLCRMNVATNFIYKNKDDACVIETTWHNVVVWDCADEFQKGDRVELEGRLRNQRYTDGLGNDHITTEIVAKSVKKVEESLEYSN